MPIPLIIFALQEAIKYAPALAVEISALLEKSNPTEQDWADLRAKFAAKTYESMVPHSGLIPTPVSS